MYFIKKIPRKSLLLNISSEQTEESPSGPIETIGCLAELDPNQEEALTSEIKPPRLMIRSRSSGLATDFHRNSDQRPKNPRRMSPKCQPAVGDELFGPKALLSRKNIIKNSAQGYQIQGFQSIMKLQPQPKQSTKPIKEQSQFQQSRKSEHLPAENERLHDEFIRSLIGRTSLGYPSLLRKGITKDKGNFEFKNPGGSRSPQRIELKPKVQGSFKMLLLRVNVSTRL